MQKNFDNIKIGNKCKIISEFNDSQFLYKIDKDFFITEIKKIKINSIVEVLMFRNEKFMIFDNKNKQVGGYPSRECGLFLNHYWVFVMDESGEFGWVNLEALSKLE